MVLSPNPISFDKGGFFDFDKDDFFCHANRPAAVDFIWPYVCLFDPTYSAAPPPTAACPPLPQRTPPISPPTAAAAVRVRGSAPGKA